MRKIFKIQKEGMKYLQIDIQIRRKQEYICYYVDKENVGSFNQRENLFYEDHFKTF